MPALVEDVPQAKGRLIMVSNRLPMSVKRNDESAAEKYTFGVASGGLVSGLSGLTKSTKFVWYGWPGLEVPEAETVPLIKQLEESADKNVTCVPVFVNEDMAELYYNGFSSTFYHSRTAAKRC